MTEGQGQTDRNDRARSNIPVPDPSLLTTQQLIRELGLLRDELARETEHVRAEAAARMDAMDAATALQLDALREVRPQTVRLITALEQLTDERFRSVMRMFEERDVRTTQASEAAKEALAAALAAAKELVTAQALAQSQAAEKAELSTTKQIDQIGLRLDALRGEQNQRIDELKERIDRGEGKTAGLGQAWGIAIAAITVLIGIVSVIVIVATR
jgi:hypothetical protein